MPGSKIKYRKNGQTISIGVSSINGHTGDVNIPEIETEQEYDPTSEQAMSGVAVAQAVSTKMSYSSGAIVQNGTDITSSIKDLFAGIPYTTTAPTAQNMDGLKFVVLTSMPDTKYFGWIYLITE